MRPLGHLTSGKSYYHIKPHKTQRNRHPMLNIQTHSSYRHRPPAALTPPPYALHQCQLLNGKDRHCSIVSTLTKGSDYGGP